MQRYLAVLPIVLAGKHPATNSSPPRPIWSGTLTASVGDSTVLSSQNPVTCQTSEGDRLKGSCQVFSNGKPLGQPYDYSFIRDGDRAKLIWSIPGRSPQSDIVYTGVLTDTAFEGSLTFTSLGVGIKNTVKLKLSTPTPVAKPTLAGRWNVDITLGKGGSSTGLKEDCSIRPLGDSLFGACDLDTDYGHASLVLSGKWYDPAADFALQNMSNNTSILVSGKLQSATSFSGNASYQDLQGSFSMTE